MNGYRLEDGSLPFGKVAYFNPARVAFSLNYVRKRWRALRVMDETTVPTLHDLWTFSGTRSEDPQTKPAESALGPVLASRNSQQVISELLAVGPDGVHAPTGVKGFTLSSMQTERDDLLSYLHITGAVTYAREGTDSHFAKRPRFCVPNLDARRPERTGARQTLVPSLLHADRGRVQGQGSGGRDGKYLDGPLNKEQGAACSVWLLMRVGIG